MANKRKKSSRLCAAPDCTNEANPKERVHAGGWNVRIYCSRECREANEMRIVMGEGNQMPRARRKSVE